jgi:dolichyl-phosphate beta-glucosyltransferase
MYDYALIIPCFKEAGRLRATHAQLCAFFATQPWRAVRVAVVYVNDGSTDNTDTVLTEISNESTGAPYAVFTHSYPVNRGKGAAIREGVQRVEANTYSFIDADLAFPLEILTTMYAMRNQADLIAGQRIHLTSQRQLRWAISRTLQWFTMRLLHLPVRDTQCGVKQFSRIITSTILPQITEDRFAFDVDLLVRTTRAGLRIIGIPLSFRYHSRSSVRILDGIRFVTSLFRIAYRSH